MNLRKWEYFLKAAEFGNLSRVAEKLDISQPALSRQITALEQELGATLFHRTGRGLVLTPAGEIFRARAETILDEIARVPEEVTHATNTPFGRLAFGAPPFMGHILIGELVAGYVRNFPHVALRVRGAHSFHLREALFFREIDVGILAAPLSEPELDIEPLLKEQMFLVGPKDSGLSPDQAVTLESVANRPLILTPRPDGLRMLIDGELGRIGRRPKIAVETEYAPVADLIRLGVGFTLLPYCSLINSPLSHLDFAPVENLEITWLIALLQNAERTLATRRFIEMLQLSAKESIKSGRWKATYIGP